MSDYSRHLEREIGHHLARILDHVGRIEGRCLAMRDTIHRELSDDYFSDEFIDGIHKGFDAIRVESELAFEALLTDADAVVLTPPPPPTPWDDPG